MRAEVLEKLGNKCVECGERDRRVLQIDHIDGGGGKEQKTITGNRYKYYLEHDCEGLQILCANCNQLKKIKKREVPNLKYSDKAVADLGLPANVGLPTRRGAPVSLRSPQMNYSAKTESEKHDLRGFKEVCNRDGLEMRLEIRKWIRTFLKKHHWPPGNPQHQLMEFTAPKEPAVAQKPKRKETDYSKLSDEELQVLNEKLTRWGPQKHPGAYAVIQYELKKRGIE